MNIIETNRLFLREVTLADQNDLFELDADPDVHLYIENKPVTDPEQIRTVIKMLQKQYRGYGIARWAVVDKKTEECLGWAGLKYFTETMNNHSHFYELGYRFKKKHWGKGYATESSAAVLDYGFAALDIESVYAITHPENRNSKKVLAKLRFEYLETFDYDGEQTDWFELKKQNWIKSHNSKAML